MAYSLLVLTLAGVNAALVIFGATLTPLIGVALIMLLILVQGFFPLVPLGINLVGISLFPQDLVGLVLIAASIIRVAAYRRGQSKGTWFLMGLMALAVVSLLRGVGLFGLQTTGVEFRGYFLFLATIWYFSLHSYGLVEQKWIYRFFVWPACALVALALLRWTALATGMFSGVLGDPAAGWRVLNASQALLLLEVWLIVFGYGVLNRAIRGTMAFRVLKWLLPLVVILLQHRTVWVCMSAAVGIWALRSETRKQVRRELAVGAGVGVVVVSVLMLWNAQELWSSLSFYLTEPFNPDGSTIAWRIEGWRTLISKDYMANWVNYLFGRPFGSGYTRIMKDYITDVGPHNYYVQTLVRMGVMGVASLIGLYTYAWRSLNRNESTGVFSSTVLRVLLLVQLMNFVTYSASPEHGLLLGLGLAVIASKSARDNSSQASSVPQRNLKALT